MFNSGKARFLRTIIITAHLCCAASPLPDVGASERDFEEMTENGP